MILAVTLGEDKDEACYRVISPAYAGAPLSGMGAAAGHDLHFFRPRPAGR